MRARLCLWPSVAAAIFMVMSAASGGQLKVVTVAAPAVNCIFNPSCIITVTDSVGQLAIQNLDKPNTAWLQSRTFTGVAGTAAAGKTGYEYRLDMTQASGALQCVAGIVINFGPITQLPYANNTPADVYVVTQGGLGTIGLGSAQQDSDVITFTFNKLICPSEPANSANTTFFFGLASAHPPTAITAGVFATGNPAFYNVPARAPQH
jgi:hypothetical protein